MIAGFGGVGMGKFYQWDAVFPGGDIYKSGRTGQALYISPETDIVVIWIFLHTRHVMDTWLCP